MLNDYDVKRILDAGISSGADFGEVYQENTESSSVAMLKGKVQKASSVMEYGIGIRLMKGVNSVYFYSNSSDVDKLIASCIAAGKSLNAVPDESFMSYSLGNLQKTNPSVCDINPLLRPKSDTVEFLRKATSKASSFGDAISETACSVSYTQRTVLIHNTYGKVREESNIRTRYSFEAIAAKGNEKQSSRVAPGALRGFEFIDSADIDAQVTKCCESAIRMVNAGYCPSGKMPVVIGNGFGGVIFHEACGHALEATAVGIKNSYFTDKLGEKIASSVVSARDDARIEGEWGSYYTDDEGNDSSNLLLIENGILKNYLIDELGSRRMGGVKPTGCARRQSYEYAPTSRMSNTYICNGDSTPEQIISNTEYGLYASDMGGGSVDTSTGDFNFAVNEGYIIRNGEICEPVRGATLIGKGSEVLMNIDMVGNDLKLAAGVCGSLSGSVPTTVGQPTIRVSSIIVGGRD